MSRDRAAKAVEYIEGIYGRNYPRKPDQAEALIKELSEWDYERLLFAANILKTSQVRSVLPRLSDWYSASADWRPKETE